MKENLYSTALILREGARRLYAYGAPVHGVGQLLALADVVERHPGQFSRLAGAALASLPGEPDAPEPGRVELVAYEAEFGARIV